jgi:RNA polymerase sigma-70 factor (ECF subfamily)
MEMEGGDTTRIRNWLRRMDLGEESALSDLIEHFRERLLVLSAKMLRDFPRVGRWEGADDVLQQALIRLSRSLRDVKPSSSKEFFGLARLQLLRELLNLAERYANYLGQSAAPCTGAHNRREPSKNEPGRLASVAEFETRFQGVVDSLPAPIREVWCLVWYDGLSLNETAEWLGVSLSRVKTLWRKARIMIGRALPELQSGRWP